MPVMFVKKTFGVRSNMKKHQLIHSGEKHSLTSLTWRVTSLYIVASVLMLAICVIAHSVKSYLWRHISNPLT